MYTVQSQPMPPPVTSFSSHLGSSSHDWTTKEGCNRTSIPIESAAIEECPEEGDKSSCSRGGESKIEQSRVLVEYHFVSNGFLNLKLLLPAQLDTSVDKVMLSMSEQQLVLERPACPEREACSPLFSIILLAKCDADKAEAVHSTLDNSVTVKAPTAVLAPKETDMSSLD